MGDLQVNVECDAPQCARQATWIVGDDVGFDYVRGHPSCDRHLAQAARVTFVQLIAERGAGRLTLRPAAQIIDAGQPPPRVVA